jgi:hypothetical protein
MRYLVRLADRALRDTEAIYEFIEAEASESAFAWFNNLARARCSHSGKQETSPSAFWEEAKHLQNYLRGG